MKCKNEGCSTELLTIAAQSSGVCPRCEAAARDRARADALARDALAELLDVDPSIAKVLAMPRTAADTWGVTTFQASIGTTRRGLASVTFVGVETGDGHSSIGDRSYDTHEDIRGAFDAVLQRLLEWADRHGVLELEKLMAMHDITNPVDLPRLIASVNEARKRDAFLPTWSELGPAISDALRRPGDLAEKLAPVFGDQIGRSLAVLREVLVERYGQAYADDLWERFNRKGP